jgi:urease accessory protein
MNGFLTALQHADSAFPSGSFAFSNGIEGLVGLGAKLDRSGLAAMIAAIIRHRWAGADRVALVHAHRAGHDFAAIAVVDATLEAATIVEPLRTGSKRNGLALLAAHARLGTPLAFELRARIDAGRTPGHLPVVQGFLWQKLGLSERDAVAISGYTTALALITAAVRLGAIGAIEGQAVLGTTLPIIAEEAAREVPRDLSIESFTPFIDAAAARHVRAPLRLFAS